LLIREFHQGRVTALQSPIEMISDAKNVFLFFYRQSDTIFFFIVPFSPSNKKMNVAIKNAFVIMHKTRKKISASENIFVDSRIC